MAPAGATAAGEAQSAAAERCAGSLTRLAAVLAGRWRRGSGLVRLVVQETTSVKLRAGAPRMRLLVPQGASAESIGRDLQVMGLTAYPLVFRLLARSRGVSGQLKAGDYALQGPLSLEQILDKLVRGEVVRRAVTVPEGRTMREIAEIVAAQGLDREAFLRGRP